MVEKYQAAYDFPLVSSDKIKMAKVIDIPNARIESQYQYPICV
jgi:hypothetical protein